RAVRASQSRSGARAPDTVFAHLVRAFALPTVSAPLGFEAPSRPDCLGSTRSNSSSSHRWHEPFAWRFSVTLLAKRKILQGCHFRVPCTPENGDQSGHAAGWHGASLEDLLG